MNKTTHGIASLVTTLVLAGCASTGPTAKPADGLSTTAIPRAEQTTPIDQPQRDWTPSEIPTPSKTAAKSADGLHQTYRFASNEGIIGSFTVPSKIGGNKLIQRIEKIRKEVHGKKLTYIVVSIDNRYGSESANMYKLVFVDKDGNQVESLDRDDVFSNWQDADDTEQYNRIIDLQNDSDVFIRPGAKGHAVMLFDKPITSISRAYVYPAGGFEMTEAITN